MNTAQHYVDRVYRSTTRTQAARVYAEVLKEHGFSSSGIMPAVDKAIVDRFDQKALTFARRRAWAQAEFRFDTITGRSAQDD